MKKFSALLLLTPGTAHAEPGALTQSLMMEPTTLFDIGVMRLETLTTEFEDQATHRVEFVRVERTERVETRERKPEKPPEPEQRPQSPVPGQQ